MSDYYGRTAKQANENIVMTSPTGYEKFAKVGPAKWWDVRAWSKKKMAIVGTCVLAVLLVVIVVPAVEVPKNRYPDYTALSYSMVDNIHGTDFFDSFDYFTGYDPTEGFVHYLLEDQMQEYVSFFLSKLSSFGFMVQWLIVTGRNEPYNSNLN